MKTTNATEQEMPELTAFLHENLNEFQPFAYYDKHMDCIRVQIRDCSFYETRINQHVTELKPLSAGDELMGFNIKGVRYMITEYLSDIVHPDMTISIAEFVNYMVKQIPDGTMNMFAQDIKPMIEALTDVEIDLAEAA